MVRGNISRSSGDEDTKPPSWGEAINTDYKT